MLPDDEPQITQSSMEQQFRFKVSKKRFSSNTLESLKFKVEGLKLRADKGVALKRNVFIINYDRHVTLNLQPSILNSSIKLDY